MERFSMLSELGTHNYNVSEISAMSDEDLIAEINSLADWDADLLEELIWRAFPDYDEPWEVGDLICYEAAEKLGGEI